MPQARPRNKNASNKRQQNQSGGRNEPAGRGNRDEDSEMNDYTDARLGSNTRRDAQPATSPSKQKQGDDRERTGNSRASTRPKETSRRANR